MRVIAGRVETRLVDGMQGLWTEIEVSPIRLDVIVPGSRRLARLTACGYAACAYACGDASAFVPTAGLTSGPSLAVYGDGDPVEVRAGVEDVRFLYVSSSPFGELPVCYRPFVRNVRAEVEQALRDLESGTFVW